MEPSSSDHSLDHRISHRHSQISSSNQPLLSLSDHLPIRETAAVSTPSHIPIPSHLQTAQPYFPTQSHLPPLQRPYQSPHQSLYQEEEFAFAYSSPSLSSRSNQSRPFTGSRFLHSGRSSLVPSTPPQNNVYVNSFRFNQDGSCFAAATTEGFRVFTSSPLSEFARRELGDPAIEGNLDSRRVDNHLNIVAMLYRSHCFAFVTHAEPKKVQLWNDREARVVGTIHCRHIIRNVLLGREVIVVVTENGVYVYLAGTVTPLHILATGYNPQGLCVISSDANIPWTLACPAVTPGAVRIQTAESVESSAFHPASSSVIAPCQGGIVFQAHQNPLSCLALNSSGSVVATASVLGTVIKIFRTCDGRALYELRLASVPHEVRGIAIRGDGMFVAATSNSLKVHIFKLDDKAPFASTAPDGTLDLL